MIETGPDRTTRRSYRMKDRAKAQAETRDRIVSATMLMHDEKGVAATSFVDIAKRAGIGAATVYRHFPTLGSLVAACGAHVWKEMDPPVPERASETFKDIVGMDDRLHRLVDEVDRFYRRGALRLTAAYADRHLIPELDGFLRAVEAGVAALVREAVKDQPLPDAVLQLVIALMDFPVWTAMQRVAGNDLERRRLVAGLLGCAIHSAR
ncbi:TetR family transcriptional regulator [Chelatococcus asaccharovorans]|uniref:TetR family transcriptional regulator n=2 Tax=Chelatococcus asaccharovorans TaxID=28210 RepID=A0A2V3UHL9_9HYPH|nr:TetR family transcriptional regulator [Chelatococcus asaccharovorans]